MLQTENESNKIQTVCLLFDSFVTNSNRMYQTNIFDFDKRRRSTYEYPTQGYYTGYYALYAATAWLVIGSSISKSKNFSHCLIPIRTN